MIGFLTAQVLRAVRTTLVVFLLLGAIGTTSVHWTDFGHDLPFHVSPPASYDR